MTPVRRNSRFCPLAAFAAAAVAILAGIGQPAQAIQAPERAADAPALHYDIRLDPSAKEQLAAFRADADRSGTDQAQARFEQAQHRLRATLPDAVVDYGIGLATPEVVARDVLSRGFLTGPGSGDRIADLRGFMKTHADLYAVDAGDIDALGVVADYVNPDGRLAWVHLEQHLHGRPVFNGEVKAGFAPDGAIIRTIGQLAPWPNRTMLATRPGPVQAALRSAARAIAVELPEATTPVLQARADGHELVLAQGPFAQDIAAQTLYFPVEPGVIRLAWRILWQPDLAWMVIVDAETGTELWRKRLTEHQNQTATYGVFTRESPIGYWPGPAAPTSDEGPLLTRGITVPRVGNEPPNTFNNLGWITDGSNSTDGNNVEVGMDRVSPNGVDPGSHAQGIPNRIFNFSYNPAPGNPAPGSEPLNPGYPPNLSNFQRGVITNVFYWTNRFHDQLYLRGFIEPARNFQHDNFGRGGLGGDRISAEVQDSSGSNNANFSTVPDGTRGRMQLYLFTAPTPQRDSGLDQTVILHELAHGLSNRLIGNSSGLTTTESRGLGEGWSDFIALSLLQSASQPQTGNYTMGAYVRQNPYYGIRRFPYASITSRGGPGNRPHAPQTFADIDPAQINLDDGAFAPNSAISPNARSVHNMGEIWALALLEGRRRIIQRLGYSDGNTRMLQIVVDGMKLSPLNPTFLQARDAVLNAALAHGDPDDFSDLWQGFAARGMGLGASSAGTTVVESFLVPLVNQQPSMGFNDGQCNGNGRIDPGERIVLDIPLTNIGAGPAADTRLSINGAPPYDYGLIDFGETMTRRLPFTVPSELACGDPLVLDVGISSSLGIQSEQRTFSTGLPVIGWSERFENVTPPALPPNWTSQTAGASPSWVTSNANPLAGNNAAFAAGPGSTGSTSLVAPAFTATGGTIQLMYAHAFVLENTFDGVVLEVALGGGNDWQDVEAVGGWFESGGYNGTLATTACASNPNPLAGRRAWSGNSDGYDHVVLVIPGISAGQSVRLRWRLGSDCSIASPTGIHVDSILVTTGQTCAAPTCLDLLFRNGYQGVE